MSNFLKLLAVLVPLFGAGAYYFFQHQDADFSLQFYEQFGPEPCSVVGGKVVWITGASSGIGEYLAYELASCGCKLVLSARRKIELKRVRDKCAGIASKHHKSYDKDKDIMVLPLDLLQYSHHKDLTNQVLKHFGQIDILVNNAGRSQRSWVKNTPLDIERGLLELNLIGTMSLTKAVLPHMLDRNQGQIIVVSSIMGKFGFPFEATYAASKFALHGYFNSLRMELGDTNLNIQIVCPGPVKSYVAANAITEKTNQSYKASTTFTDKIERMPTERCSRLMAVAMANNLTEAWISTQPCLSLVYMSQYMPSVFDRYTRKRFLSVMKNIYIANSNE